MYNVCRKQNENVIPRINRKVLIHIMAALSIRIANCNFEIPPANQLIPLFFTSLSFSLSLSRSSSSRCVFQRKLFITNLLTLPRPVTFSFALSPRYSIFLSILSPACILQISMFCPVFSSHSFLYSLFRPARAPLDRPSFSLTHGIPLPRLFIAILPSSSIQSGGGGALPYPFFLLSFLPIPPRHYPLSLAFGAPPRQ